jgi:hypothetical protein
MGKKLYPSNVLKEAIRVQSGWKKIDERLVFGELKIDGLTADIQGIYQNQPELVDLEHQLLEVRNRRDALYLAAWEKVKRVRANIKGLYGDDSIEYELVGGTRRSDRKRARRIPVTE